MPAAILTLTKRTPPTALSTALAFFARHGSAKFRADMSARYGIATRDKTFGVPMAKLHLLAKQLGRDHALAQALWATGIYEARMLAAFVEEPHRVRPRRWTAGRAPPTIGPSQTRSASSCSPGASPPRPTGPPPSSAATR